MEETNSLYFTCYAPCVQQARGTTYEGLMHVTDWTATLASVTGIPTVRTALFVARKLLLAAENDVWFNSRFSYTTGAASLRGKISRLLYAVLERHYVRSFDS